MTMSANYKIDNVKMMIQNRLFHLKSTLII